MKKNIISIGAVSIALAFGMLAMPTFARMHQSAKRHKAAPVHAITGIVRSVSGGSLTITAGKKKSYKVIIQTGTKITDRLHHSITLNQIAAKDKVQVAGSSTQLAITAQTIRDLTLPRHVASSSSATSAPVDAPDVRAITPLY